MNNQSDNSGSEQRHDDEELKQSSPAAAAPMSGIFIRVTSLKNQNPDPALGQNLVTQNEESDGQDGLDLIPDLRASQQRSMDSAGLPHSSSHRQQEGSAGREDQLVMTGRQSARSADDEVDKAFFEKQQQLQQQQNAEKDQTPDKIRSSDLEKYRDMSPAGGSLIKSARSLHTKENMQNKSSVITQSKNNADLMDDLGMKNENQLTRNQKNQRPNLTSQEERKALAEIGVMVSDKVDLMEQQSINLTDFKSFQEASEEHSKNNVVFSSKCKDNLAAALIDGGKKSSSKMMKNQMESKKYATMGNNTNSNQNKNKDVIKTVNTDLADVQSMQGTEPINIITTTSAAQVPQINLAITDQFMKQKQSAVNSQLKSPRHLQSKKKMQSKQHSQLLQSSSGATKQRLTQSPTPNHQTRKNSQQGSLKPFYFGKAQPDKTHAVAFSSSLVAKHDLTPSKVGHQTGEQLITDSQNKKHSKMLNSTNKAANSALNLQSLQIAGGNQHRQASSKQQIMMFKQQAPGAASAQANNNDGMPEVNGRGLIGKNQYQPINAKTIYSGFRPAKIKKSKRNFLTTNSFSANRSRDNQEALSTQQQQDAAIVNMTPMNHIPQSLINNHAQSQESIQAENIKTKEEPQTSLYKLPQGAQSYGIIKYQHPDAASLSSQSSDDDDQEQGIDDKSKESSLKVLKKAADTQVDMPSDHQEPQIYQDQENNHRFTLNVQTPQTDTKTLHKEASGSIFHKESLLEINANKESLLEINAVSRGEQNDTQQDLPMPDTQLLSQNARTNSKRTIQTNQDSQEFAAQQNMMRIDTGEIQNITGAKNDNFLSNQPERVSQDQEIIQASAMAIASKTEESRQEDNPVSQRLFSENMTQQVMRNNHHNDDQHTQGRQHFTTSKTNARSSSGHERHHGSYVESSIANIQCIPPASNGKQTNDLSQKMLYAEKVLITQSSEPVTVSNINVTTQLNSNLQTMQQVMNVPVLNVASSTDELNEQNGLTSLHEVQELGEVSTGNLGTLQRSGVTDTQSYNHGSVEAGFGQLAKSRVEQSQQKGATDSQQRLQSAGPTPVGKVLVINEEKAESATGPEVPQLHDLQNADGASAAGDQKIQHTERPVGTKNKNGVLASAAGEDSSVTGTHQQAQYLMSNRYSNRESMQLLKGGPVGANDPNSGNKSYSFGMVAAAKGLKATNHDSKKQNSALAEFTNKASKKQATKHNMVTSPVQQMKIGTKNEPKALTKSVAVANQTKDSSVSPFKKSLNKTNLSSITTSQNMQQTTTNGNKNQDATNGSNHLSPIINTTTNNDQQNSHSKNKVSYHTVCSTESNIVAPPSDHAIETLPDQNKIIDNSIEVEDQQQKQQMVQKAQTIIVQQQQKQQQQHQVTWQPAAQQLQQQQQQFKGASGDEYGYFVQGVQQFDQFPPPSSGHMSNRAAPAGDLSQHPTKENPPTDSISSPKLTDLSKTSPKIVEPAGGATGAGASEAALYNNQGNNCSSNEKYAELLSITDPVALEQRLKSLLQSKNMFFSADKATPGINIQNEENKEQQVVEEQLAQAENDKEEGLENLTNVRTTNKNPPFNVFDHGGQKQYYGQQHHQMDPAYMTHTNAGGHQEYYQNAANAKGIAQQNQMMHIHQHNLFNVTNNKKPMTAGGTTVFQKSSTLLQGMTTTASGRQKRQKFTVVDKYNPAATSGTGMRTSSYTKPSSRDYTRTGTASHQMARTTLMPFSMSHGSLANSDYQKQMMMSTGNFVANTVGVLYRQIQSGEIKMYSPRMMAPELDAKLDVIGKNPLKKFKNELVQINLIKQMKVILDPTAKSVDLYRAGFNFIKLLFGENYKPNETEVSEIVHFICSNPTIPLENLIRVSNTVSSQQKELMDQKIQDNKQQVSRRTGPIKKIGFGRAISDSSSSQVTGRFCSTGYLTLDKDKMMNPQKQQQFEVKRIESEEEAAQVKQSMKLNAISKQICEDHRKKEERLENYKTKVLKRQIEELRQSMGPEIFSEQLKAKFGSRSLEPVTAVCRTPVKSTQNNLSQCSTFDNVTPLRIDQATGAATYITQMAQVDMDMRNQNGQPQHIRSHSEIQAKPPANNHSTKKPIEASIATAGKLSMLLNAQNNSLKTYIEAKKRMSMASQINGLASNKKSKKAHIMNRMVPSDKSQLTEMLHQYIQAFKFKSASDGDGTRKQHFNAAAATNSATNGAFSLVTGQSEAIKEQYSAVTMHPKEKVNQLLKYRDELRKLARDSNRIGSKNKSEIKRLQQNMKASTISDPNMQLAGHGLQDPTANAVAALSAEQLQLQQSIYEQRRVKVMSQFRTIEKIKQMENGSRNIIPKNASKNNGKNQQRVSSHKQLPSLRINNNQAGAPNYNNNNFNSLTNANQHSNAEQELEEFTQFIQDSGLHQQQYQDGYVVGQGSGFMIQGTKSFTEMPHLPQLDHDDNEGGEDSEVMQAVERDDEAAMTKHFENIENDVNQEPAMIYKKNNLLLEKIILDRALNKVQKRRFIKSNIPK